MLRHDLQAEWTPETESLLKRIGELESYNKQIDRLEEVRLLQLRHARRKLLQRRSLDEVSVLSFACTASAPSPTSEVQEAKPVDSRSSGAEATLESTSKREEQLRQLDELLEQSGEIKERLQMTQSSVEQATKAACAATERRVRDVARARVRNAVNEELRAEAAAERLRRSVRRQTRAAQRYASASSEGTWSPKGTTVRSDSAASSPVQKVMEDAAEQRKEDAQNYKAEFREWASELEERAKCYFASELQEAKASSKDTEKLLRMSLEAKKLELDATISEHVRVTGEDIHARARRKVDLARKTCQIELKKLRTEAHEAPAQPKALEQRLRQASEALELVRAQEQEQMKAMEEASEAAFTRLTAQFQEEAARKLGQLEASQRAQEARLVRREEQSTLAQSGATLKAWRTRLEDAERAEEAAQAELRQASEMQEQQWQQSIQRVERLLERSPASTIMMPLEGGKVQVDLFDEDNVFCEGAQADETARTDPNHWTLSPRGSDEKIPLVYEAALEGIEAHGWSAVYPPDDPPTWTILHWAAMEGRVDVCRRLLLAAANPMCQDDRGWTPMLCAQDANKTEVLSLMHAFLPNQQPEDSVDSLPAIISASVEAVESYGWQAMHGGRNDWTALHWAAAEGRQVLCARLLRENADPTQVDDAGKSALDYAQDAGHRSTWLLLWQAHQENATKASSATSYGSYPQSLLLPSK